MKFRLAVALLIMSVTFGCSSKQETPATAANPASNSTEQAAAPGTQETSTPAAETVKKATLKQPDSRPTPAPKAVSEVVIPAGTKLTIRTASVLGSERSKTGDSFAASLDEPISVNGNVVVPKGAEISGTVVEAKKKGKIKGEARLELTLNSIEVKGKEYPIQTSMTNEVAKGKGTRTAVATGGGAAAGALIGGLVGGGKGAGIGALIGGGGGFVGGALTGNKQIELPAETLLVFELNEPLKVK